MKFIFEQQLDKELLLNEKKRTTILLTVFSVAITFRVINIFLFKVDEQTKKVDTLGAVWMFPVIIILFELFSLLHINRRLKTNRKKLPLALQYLNTAFEICLPSFVILYVAKHFPQYNVLESPAIFIYFIFIILSTLRLNFLLSIFCGLLSGLSYAVFSYFVYGHFDSNDAGRSFILFFSGVAAGLVAKQIRAGINHTLLEAERRHKVENLFGQQLSLEVAEKMLANDGKIESKKMTVAIMFIDIRNFTSYASTRNPEEIVKYQNSFFSIVLNAVTKHQGIVHQFLGDGCMVVFGAPVDIKNPSENAVNAAKELLNALDAATKAGEMDAIRIGIGIHTGEVVTGNIGNAERQQYSITGHVVILASRIEQLNKQFDSRLLVSGEVANRINTDSFETTCFESVDIKGWQKPISIYKLA